MSDTAEVRAASVLAYSLLHDVGRRWAHVQGVAAKAHELVEALGPAQAETVEAAAWLHDVGYSQQVVETGFHPLDGARYL